MIPKVFIIDDNNVSLAVAKESLQPDYIVITMPCATHMFTLIDKVMPSLIVLDIGTPTMTGFETLHLLKSNTRYQHIPVIFLSAIKNSETEAQGFRNGICDFILKPFSPEVLSLRVRHQLNTKYNLQEKSNQLKKHTAQLKNLQDGIIFTLADLIEGRDKSTGDHVNRTSVYMRLLLEKMMHIDIYAQIIGELDFESLVVSSKLHDIGKFVVSDTIINKTNRLTDQEFEIMKQHPTEGERIISQISAYSPNIKFLENAKIIAVSHHEKWDGSGYPNALKGSQIPLPGRIMAIVDVFDALTSDRPYKMSYSPAEATEIILKSAGTHFDPKLVDIFYDAKNEFIKLAEQFKLEANIKPWRTSHGHLRK